MAQKKLDGLGLLSTEKQEASVIGCNEFIVSLPK
jgi:hypothetical protein